MHKRLPVLPGRQRPLLFAHRGQSTDAPENTMAAFSLARERGIPGIELDIHITKDGAILVIHDDDTERVVPGSAFRINSTSAKELRSLDVGSWKGSQWRGEKIPILAEVLEEYKGSLYFDIEIKGRTTQDLGLEAALADLLQDFRMGPESIVVSSFNPIILRRFKILSPHIPTAIIYCNSDELPRYLHKGQGRWIAAADFLKPKFDEISYRRIAMVKKMRLRPIIPWTVDEGSDAEALLNSGAEGLVSNHPDSLGIPLSQF